MKYRSEMIKAWTELGRTAMGRLVKFAKKDNPEGKELFIYNKGIMIKIIGSGSWFHLIRVFDRYQ